MKRCASEGETTAIVAGDWNARHTEEGEEGKGTGLLFHVGRLKWGNNTYTTLPLSLFLSPFKLNYFLICSAVFRRALTRGRTALHLADHPESFITQPLRARLA